MHVPSLEVDFMAHDSQSVKTTLATIRSLGLSASYRHGEYRITVAIGSMQQREDLAYYTDDSQDAINTAKEIAAQANHMLRPLTKAEAR